MKVATVLSVVITEGELAELIGMPMAKVCQLVGERFDALPGALRKVG